MVGLPHCRVRGAGRGVRRFDGPDDTRVRSADPPSFRTDVYHGGAHAGDGRRRGRQAERRRRLAAGAIYAVMLRGMLQF